MEESDTILIEDEFRTSNQSKWWKPLDKVVFQKNKDISYMHKNKESWIFGVQRNKMSGEVLRHNYWFYYYSITALLASIYIFILSVNLFMLIPYSFISGLFITISTLIFFATFVGLIALIVYVDIQSQSVVPQSAVNTSTTVFFIFVPIFIFIVVMYIIAMYEQRPLVMVGIMLLGIDLLIFWYILGISNYSRREMVIKFK